MSAEFCLPNAITPEQFFAEYWQKKPLLIRQGIPKLANLFSPDDIMHLSCNRDATSRMIKQLDDENDNWEVTYGPFELEQFIGLPKRYSLLVQNLEQWSAPLADMWNAFGFIPQWQRDDIMVSVAPSGASVGKHYDEYDVFLVQGYGHRRWQLGKWCDSNTKLREGQPLRLLEDMGEIIFDEVLAPGDILYVPARLSHYGVAEDLCVTFSFGFRNPSVSDFLDQLQQDLSEDDPDLDLSELSVPMRFSDEFREYRGFLSSEMIAEMKRQFVEKITDSPAFDRLFRQSCAHRLSMRRYELLFDEDIMNSHRVMQQLLDGAMVMQDNNSRVLYMANKKLYINGERIEYSDELEYLLLCHFADGHSLTLKELEKIALTWEDHNAAICRMFKYISNWINEGWVLLV